MRFQTAAAGWRGLLLSTLLCTGALAKKDKPSVKSSKFDFLPRRVQYFDDSDVILLADDVDRITWRSGNAGVDWDKVTAVPDGITLTVSMHPFDPKRAYIITAGRNHWRTSDRGETWEEFVTDTQPSEFRRPLGFHAADPDKIIFNGMDCTGPFCAEIAMYTTDGFSSGVKLLRRDTAGCQWAKSSDLFTTGQEDLDSDRILCVAIGRFSPWREDLRLLISDEYFVKEQEFEPELEPGRTVQGIIKTDVVNKYLIAGASSKGTDEMALYVSDDAIKWHRAIFPHGHKLTESEFTLLQGTNYSIQLDALTSRPSAPIGVMLSSNSNGTYFTQIIEHTNRNMDGYVDFEKVSGIQGIFLVNTVKNFKDVQESGAEKELTTEITFDDGRTFQALKVNDERLHLHSITHMTNSGPVFSSPAPGLVMGIGNTGDYLKKYKDGDLYVSNNAGVTWRQGLKGAHKYEFGASGSILVAVRDNGKAIGEVKYSLNHGKDWDAFDIDVKIKPVQLTTTKDSTSLKFLLEGVGEVGQTGYIITLDFNDMHERECKDNDDDMENWSARVNDKGEPTCLMGHTQTYRRRKADVDCFVKNEFVDPVPVSEPCACTDADFECDFNFVRSDDRTECIAASGAPIIPEGECTAFGPETTFKASSGWRQIPGNDCKRDDDKKYKDAPVEKKCADAAAPPSSGKITHKQNPYIGTIVNSIYLERTDVSEGDDETIVIQTEKSVFLSHDHGKQPKEIPELKGEGILAIIAHPYFNDVVYFVTHTEKVYYSVDRGENIRSFKAPFPPTEDWRMGVPIMSFHPTNKDWIIWMGKKDCQSSEGCHNIASLTTNRGDSAWKTLQRYAKKCEFIREPEKQIRDADARERRKKLIYCQVNESEDNKSNTQLKLVSSTDFFETTPTFHFKNIVNFATMSEFIVVARKDDEAGSLKAAASVDGEVFADANFPYGFVVDHQQGYTVLESSTHAVFLHVTVNNEPGLEYGTLIKSNSNGTSYALSLSGVDRDTKGYVDFEKMYGVEGLAMVNVVANYGSKNYEKERKKVKSMITHNDGAEWNYLQPPAKDSEGKGFGCSGSLEKCALHLHGYTDRKDKAHTFYSTSALGFMFGVGNVGEHLTDFDSAYTFLSTDGGIGWKAVKKGQYMWEFGDQGSILVLVKDDKPTKVIHYSLDGGDTWLDYEFSDHDINVYDITTLPSDNSRNFLLWALDGGKSVTVNLDFTGLTDVPCKLDENDVLAGDYELWTPRHPNQDDDCLFGHISQYHRKKKSAECYNGRIIPHLHDIAKNCSCTRRDYECDYNFEPQIDGSCQLVKGLEPPNHEAQCLDDPDLIEYFEVTGYRRIPASTCQGGKEFDVSIAHPCENHRDAFNRKHGMSGVAIFFAVTIPIAAAVGIGYWVWRNGGSKFGQIRLGEQGTFDGEAPWVKYPVMAIAGLVAIAQALPFLAASLWRSLSEALGRRGSSRRFTTRDSFARGRGDYAIVDEDEGELLGDESDDEV